jgi:hypothetical protein
VADDLGREAIAGVAGANGRRHPFRLPAMLPIRKPDSSQIDGAFNHNGARPAQLGCLVCADRL